MAELVKVPLTLTKKQFHRLKNGHKIQLSHIALAGDRHHIMLHPKIAKKIHRAIREKRGARIDLTPEEFEMSGEGLREFWDGIMKGAKFVKDKIIDSKLYQENLKPIVRKGVNYLTNLGKAVASPIIGDDLTDLAVKGIDYVGAQSGAYGLRHNIRGMPSACRMKSRKMKIMPEEPKRVKFELSNDRHQLLGANHPAMHPHRDIGNSHSGIGGSFRGGSFRM